MSQITDEQVEAALARWFIGEDISDCTEEMIQQFRSDMRATLLAASSVPKTIQCDYPACVCMIKCDEIHDNVAYTSRPAPVEPQCATDEIEQAAKALYEEDDVWNVAFPWPNLAEGQTSADTYRRLARAAVSAAAKALSTLPVGAETGEPVAWARQVDINGPCLVLPVFLRQADVAMFKSQQGNKDTVFVPLFPSRSDKANGDYLVWSNEHRAWWRHKSQGYARNILEAGRYTRAEAVDIADKSRNGWELDRRPDEIAVAIADLPAPIRAALAAAQEARE